MAEDVILPFLFFVGLVIILVACFKHCLERNQEREGDDVERDGWERVHNGGIQGFCYSLFQLCSERNYQQFENNSLEQVQTVQRSPQEESVLRILKILESPEQVTTGQTQQLSGNSSQPQNPEVTQSDIKNCLEYIQNLPDQGDSKEEILKTIRLVQNILLLQKHPPTEASLQTTLIIGVDARPSAFGGYCVNLEQKSLEYYIIKKRDFPWEIENPSDPSEFEMKNLQFALAVWSKSIRKYKKFRIYTDNNAIEGEDNEFGLDAKELLEHFTECEDAERVNECVYINRREKLVGFAKYIQAADDFSRFEIDKGIDFLCQYYGIDKRSVRGTHKLKSAASEERRARYDQNEFYDQKIQRVKTFSKKFRCENCSVDVILELQQLQPKNSNKRRKQQRNQQYPNSMFDDL